MRTMRQSNPVWLGQRRAARSAVAALPSILLIGSVLLELAIVGAFLAYIFTTTGYGIKLSSEALAAARAGAQDGILRVIRDKSYGASSYTPACSTSDGNGYAFTVNSRTVCVVVLKDQPSSGLTTLYATATALTRQKKVKVVLSVDATTGKVDVSSFEEVTF